MMPAYPFSNLCNPPCVLVFNDPVLLILLPPLPSCLSTHSCLPSGQVFHIWPSSKDIKNTGRMRSVPKLRAWLGGSAGSGKSTTLKTCVAHVRLLFRQADIPATVALTAYTGVAAFNMSFGAKTACSTFQIFPNAPWKKELSGESLRKLEAQWSKVVLLIVDEVSFIGTAFFARMHYRTQQGKREYFSTAALDPSDHCFGDCSVLLIGDFGQLEPIGDVSLCDRETTYQTCPKAVRPLWRHVRDGRHLLQLFDEAFMLRRVHRSKDDLWWTESCLRLRDFACTKEGDYDVWREHDLDRGHLSDEQKAYFENEAETRSTRESSPSPRRGKSGPARREDCFFHYGRDWNRAWLPPKEFIVHSRPCPQRQMYLSHIFNTERALAAHPFKQVIVS